MRRALIVSTLVLCSCCALPARAGARRAPAEPRYLLICLDGVGYDVVQELHAKGELKNFQPPQPVINTFPSLTNLGLVEILRPLGAPASPGYEDYFFDPVANRMRGGLFYRLSPKKFIRETYRGVFDYHPHPIRMTLEYSVPALGPWLNGVIGIARIKAAFRKSEARVFLAYFDASDLASHLHGGWLVGKQLGALDRLAGELRAESQGKVEVILFSDHGNAGQDMKRVDLAGTLERAGFRAEGRLRNERSVVIPEFGLVGAVVLYTEPGQEAAVAAALQAAKGVDVVAYREEDTVRVVGPLGNARVERRALPDGVAFRYRADQGDPLQLREIIEQLEYAGRVSADGYIQEEDWLHATAMHEYPDPLRRLWSGFDSLVEHPASVLVSLQDDYYTGSIWLDVFAHLQATHGNLGRAQSLGMVLASPGVDLPGDEEPLTGKNLLAQLGLHPVRPRAYVSAHCHWGP